VAEAETGSNPEMLKNKMEESERLEPVLILICFLGTINESIDKVKLEMETSEGTPDMRIEMFPEKSA
jgi:hypothetical protein